MSIELRIDQRRATTLVDSLVALLIISGGIAISLDAMHKMNQQLIDSRIQLEIERSRYENQIMQ